MLRKKTEKIKGPSGCQWKDITISQDGRYGAPGEKRKPKTKPTPEQIRRQNHRNKVRKIWQLLRGNFSEGDRWLTFTYRKGDRPDWDTAQKQLAALRKKISVWYRKAGVKLRMVYSIERGSRGAIHMHMVLGYAQGADRMLDDAWQYGHVYSTALYKQGGFRDLAEYIAKGEKYNHSRGMTVTREEKPRLLRRADLLDYPKAEKGWQVMKESVEEGINPVTGCPFLRYTLVKEVTGSRGRQTDV